MTSCASYLSSRLASVMPIAKAPTGAAMTAQDRARSTRSEIRFRLGFSPRRELLTAMRGGPPQTPSHLSPVACSPRAPRTVLPSRACSSPVFDARRPEKPLRPLIKPEAHAFSLQSRELALTLPCPGRFLVCPGHLALERLAEAGGRKAPSSLRRSGSRDRRADGPAFAISNTS